MYTIYRITSPRNKYYIGITKNFSQRKKQHIKNMTSKRHGMQRRKLVMAYHKHKPENMLMERIASAKTLQDAKAAEIQLIEQYNSYHNGYNMTLGGDHAQVKNLTVKDIDTIRDLLENTSKTLKEIGSIYNVSDSLISQICRNVTYEGWGNARKIERGLKSYARGERTGNSRFTEQDIIAIKKSYNEGKSSQYLSKKYKTSRTQICDILNEKIWKGVGPKKVNRRFRGNSKYTEREVREVWELYIKGNSIKQITEITDIKYATVRSFIKGVTWTDLYDEYIKKLP